MYNGAEKFLFMQWGSRAGRRPGLGKKVYIWSWTCETCSILRYLNTNVHVIVAQENPKLSRVFLMAQNENFNAKPRPSRLVCYSLMYCFSHPHLPFLICSVITEIDPVIISLLSAGSMSSLLVENAIRTL